jgi:hypothetical protein
MIGNYGKTIITTNSLQRVHVPYKTCLQKRRTPHSRDLLVKLTVIQQVKKYLFMELEDLLPCSPKSIACQMNSVHALMSVDSIPTATLSSYVHMVSLADSFLWVFWLKLCMH